MRQTYCVIFLSSFINGFIAFRGNMTDRICLFNLASIFDDGCAFRILLQLT